MIGRYQNQRGFRFYEFPCNPLWWYTQFLNTKATWNMTPWKLRVTPYDSKEKETWMSLVYPEKSPGVQSDLLARRKIRTSRHSQITVTKTSDGAYVLFAPKLVVLSTFSLQPPCHPDTQKKKKKSVPEIWLGNQRWQHIDKVQKSLSFSEASD